MVQLQLYQLFACFGIYYYNVPLAQSFSSYEFVSEIPSFLSSEQIKKGRESRLSWLKREEEIYVKTVISLFSLINGQEKLHWRYELISLVSLILVLRPNHVFQSELASTTLPLVKSSILSFFLRSLQSQSPPLRFLS